VVVLWMPLSRMQMPIRMSIRMPMPMCPFFLSLPRKVLSPTRHAVDAVDAVPAAFGTANFLFPWLYYIQVVIEFCEQINPLMLIECGCQVVESCRLPK